MRLKVKGMGPTIGVQDWVQIKDTRNTRKKGLQPDAGGKIMKINKSESIVIESNTDKAEADKVTVNPEDVYYKV